MGCSCHRNSWVPQHPFQRAFGKKTKKTVFYFFRCVCVCFNIKTYTYTHTQGVWMHACMLVCVCLCECECAVDPPLWSQRAALIPENPISRLGLVMLVYYGVCVRVCMCVDVWWGQRAWGWVRRGLLGHCSYRLGLFQIRCEIPSTHHQFEDISVKHVMYPLTFFLRTDLLIERVQQLNHLTKEPLWACSKLMSADDLQ